MVRIDLSGKICIEEGCTKLKFSDTTGFLVTACNDEQNYLGYGLAGGIALDDVTSARLNVYYVGMTVPIIFNFTIVNHVITAATITGLDLVVTNIFPILTSNVFPLYEFDITKDYGIIVPQLTDGIIKWDYTINGVASDEVPFSYTTSGEDLSDCKLNCCITEKYTSLDPNCDCFGKKKQDLINSEIFFWGAKYSMDIGKDSKSESFLNKGTELCNTNCKDC